MIESHLNFEPLQAKMYEFMSIVSEIEKRKPFGNVSHPDAGTMILFGKKK